MRVAFMGTPDFAVPSLITLAEAGHDVAGVFTQPDQPAGRGHKLAACPVKLAAVERGLPVFQFRRIRGAQGVAALRELAPDLCVTAAFGQILSQTLLGIPRLGTINVHASLLPRWRGPAPINWAIMAGDRETGVTTMLTDAGIDTGDMLMASRVVIGETETSGELTGRLALAGAALLAQTIKALEAGDCPRERQDESLMTHAPMLDKTHGEIDWARPARELERLVRGVNPWPGAYTSLPDGGTLKVWSALASDEMPETDNHTTTREPGTLIFADQKRGMVVATGRGALRLSIVQVPGGKRMSDCDCLRGKPMAAGLRLGGK